MSNEELKDLQKSIRRLREMISREVEFSPSCSKCSDSRFYESSFAVIKKIEALLTTLNKYCGPEQKRPYPYEL